MPVRYILADSQTKNMVPANIAIMDSIICHKGGEKAKRAGIIIGAKSGNMDENIARLLFGTLIAANII